MYVPPSYRGGKCACARVRIACRMFRRPGTLLELRRVQAGKPSGRQIGMLQPRICAQVRTDWLCVPPARSVRSEEDPGRQAKRQADRDSDRVWC